MRKGLCIIFETWIRGEAALERGNAGTKGGRGISEREKNTEKNNGGKLRKGLCEPWRRISLERPCVGKSQGHKRISYNRLFSPRRH